jgi:DNA repair protein RecO (recombination protein O)
MPAVTLTGLVVRGTDWSETSRIVTLFTREAGPVRAVAKGGRRLKSGFEIAFDLLTVCRVGIIRKGHGGLDLLTEAVVEERFPHLRTDLRALYAGYYVAELLADGTREDDPHPDLFDAAVETLREAGGDRDTVAGRVSAFELVWLRELGYSPRFDGCAACGNAVPAGRAWYSAAAGGLVCPTCLPTTADRRPLSGAAVETVRRLIAGTATPLEGSVRTEVRPLLGHAVATVLGRRPKLLGYVDGG